MIDGQNVLAIIPARGGSKGVPRKNIRVVEGKPLIAWTIEEAKKSKYIDRLILSSDDTEIIEVAKSWGCDVPFVRPSEMARDDSPGIAPVLHAMEMLPEYDVVVVLQATSPLRSVEDIDGCITYCVDNGANACVSVTEATESPYWMYTRNAHGIMAPVMPASKTFGRRQNLPPVYILNGAVYVANAKWLLRHKTFLTEESLGFIMAQERALDIDTELDLELLRVSLQKKSQEK